MQRMTLTFLLGLGLSLSACDSDDGGAAPDTDAGTSGTSTTGTTGTASDSDAASDTAQTDSDSNSGPDSTSSTGGQESSSGGSSGGGSTGFGSSSGSSGFGSSSSSGGEDDGLYGPCPGDQACEGDYECTQIGGGQNAGTNWCTQDCDVEAQDCPAPAQGDAQPFCRGEGGGGGGKGGQCLLSCEEDTTCPTGMDCITFGPGGGVGVCVFPADF
ncbi:MAG: hypothetical protein KUG77_02110 [Nannocystaceae bacterium]|nr:hypothetical protein [Nannocystaceae bacterium]